MRGARTTVADLCMSRLAACDEREPGFVNTSKRTSPMHDNFECGCKANVKASIDMLVLVQATRARRWNNQEHGYINLPKQ